MRKRRSDSPWNKLTEAQKEQMDCWFFDENLGHQEILERAEKEFGIKASQPTLTAYFRHRERLLNLPDGIREIEPEEENALATRLGAGMEYKNLKARTLRFTAMAAYEMALAEPEQMQVKEIRLLMKMLSEHERLTMDNLLRERKLELQRIALEAKIKKDQSGRQTKEEFEAIVMETSDLVNRLRRKDTEILAAMEAEKKKREAENQEGEQAETEEGESNG